MCDAADHITDKPEQIRQKTGTDAHNTAEDPGGADPEHHTAEPVIYLTDKARHALQSRQGSRRPDTYNSQTAGTDRQKGGTMDISKQLDSKSLEEFKLIRARGLADIQKTAKSVKLQTARRIAKKYGQSLDSATAAEMYKNCALSAACVLIDRWGMNFEKDICTALDLDPVELNDYLVEDEIAEAAELKEKPNYTPEELQAFVSYADFAAESLERVLEDLGTLQHRAIDGFDVSGGLAKLKERITAISDGDTAKIKELDAADDGTKSGTGAADPGTVSEIMKRLNRIEESLHSIGQQVEAIWLKTGAVELDAESIADPEGQQDTQTGAADAGSNAEILRRLERIEDSIHNIGTQVEAIWLHTGAAMLDDEGQAK